MKTQNNLIVFEGLDGTGKTTIANELVWALQRRGISSVYKSYEKEYFQESFSMVRKINNPNAKYLIQLAALTKLGEDIKTYSDETLVICDRYLYSASANYDTLSSKEKTIKTPVQIILPQPKIKILLECSSPIRKKRLLMRDGTMRAGELKRLGAIGFKIQSRLLEYSPWLRINTEKFSIQECVNIAQNEIFHQILRIESGF